jgi:RNA polymerase sigma factor (sigma-70 family)
MTLTPERQALVAENEKLIWYMLKKFHLDDEYYGVAAIALCQAAIRYEKGKVKFDTFACYCIRRALQNEFTLQNAQKRTSNIIELDALMPETDNLTYDCFLVANDTPETMLNRSELLDFIEKMPDIYRSTIQMRLKGYKNDEIAAHMGTTYKAVTMRLTHARKDIKQYLAAV